MENKRTRLQKGLLAALAVMTLAFAVLLFINRSQGGIELWGSFLEYTQEGERRVYAGHCEGEDVTITVSPTETGTQVVMTAGKRSWPCLVEPWPDYQPPAGSTFRETEGIRVTVGEETLFQGGYDREKNWLIGQDGEPHVNGAGVYTVGGNRSIWDVYEPSPAFILRLAGEPELAHRGSVMFYILMVLATGFLAMDVAFPEALFRFQHILSVRDPEPTDFYRFTQKIGWFVTLALLLWGYVYAVTVVV